jgi:hypothetical protein
LGLGWAVVGGPLKGAYPPAPPPRAPPPQPKLEALTAQVKWTPHNN